MLVNAKAVRTIWFDDSAQCVQIIDQTRLPHCFEIIALNTLEQACNAIISMQVRGAPLIGVTAAYGVYLAMRDGHESCGRASVSE